MNKILFLSLVCLSSVVNAAFIDRIDFDANAINYGFDGVVDDTVNITDGILSISNGFVVSNDADDFDPSLNLVTPFYFDGGDSSVIKFDFSSLISAIGLDFVSNNADTTLSLFGVSGNLLESFTLTTTNQLSCGGFPCGFIGIDFGSNSISYATIDTPLNGGELLVDNITYQPVSSVPTPAAVWLFGTGLIGLIGIRKKPAKLSKKYA